MFAWLISWKHARSLQWLIDYCQQQRWRLDRIIADTDGVHLVPITVPRPRARRR
jgi:hypothetical protein